MYMRHLMGTRSIKILPINQQEEPSLEQINHNRAFCELYLNNDPITTKAKKVLKSTKKKSTNKSILPLPSLKAKAS